MLLRFSLAWFAVAALAGTSLEEGLARLAEGRLDAAQRALRAAIEQNPDSAPTHNAFGVALSRAGSWPQAVEEFRKAVHLAPEHPEARFNLGIALSAQKQHAEAAAAFGTVLDLRPEFTEARTGLLAALRAVAATHTEQDESHAATRNRRDLLALEPSPNELADLAAVLLLHGELIAAQAALEEAIRQQPDLALAHFLLGRRFELAGNSKAARRKYREGARLDPRNVEFMLRYGAILCQTEPREGIAILTKALASVAPAPATKRDDPRVQAHFALGRAWARIGNREQAESHFEQARARRAQVHAREEALIHLNQGIALLNSGDARAAAAAFQRSVAVVPDLPEALHMLGVAHSALDEWPDAHQFFSAALEARPKDAYILSSYAKALYHRGLAEQALSRLEESLEVDPERLDARCLLEQVRLQLGRRDGSGNELERNRMVGACGPSDQP